MWQFCRRHLNNDPEGDDPAQQEQHFGFAPAADQHTQAAGKNETPRPEGYHYQHQMCQWRRTMGFLTLLQFIDKIALDRGLQKRTVGGMGHQHHPGQHHHSHRNETQYRAQTPKPVIAALANRDRGGGHDGDDRCDWPLDQYPEGKTRPEADGQSAADMVTATGSDKDAPEQSLLTQSHRSQHGIGLGQMRLGRKDKASRHQHGGDHRLRRW